MKNISIIVAIAENNVIGKDNQLLWHIPEDLKRFKRLTTGHKIIMGKSTFISLPKGPLPSRTNIVISDNKNDKFEGCIMAYSIEEAISKCDDKKENFVIGGGMIYKQFLPYANKLYLTKIYQSFEGDTYFPEINFEEWEKVEHADFKPDEKNKYAYSYQVFEREKGKFIPVS